MGKGKGKSLKIAKCELVSKIQWTSGNPTKIMQGSVGLSNLLDYRVLPNTDCTLYKPPIDPIFLQKSTL